MKRFGVLLLTLASLVSWGEDAKAKAAREELERQLQGLMGTVPTKVRIDYAELSDPNYELQEASFELDGKPLTTPPPGALSMADESILVWHGDVSAGKHVVRVKLRYKNIASVVMSNEGGHEWTLSGDRSFDQQSGIEVRVLVKTSIDPKNTNIEKRLVLSLPAQPVMLAKLDDGSMPAPPPKPVIDAGPTPEQLAAAQKAAAEEEKKKKAEEALAAKQAAAAEKKRKAEEALAAKQAAAEAKRQKLAEAAALKKQKAEDAKAAKAAAAEEKKRKAEEAKAARLAAAEEQKRQAAEKLAAAEEAKRQAEAARVAPIAEVDAGAAVAVAEVVDAGVPEIDAGAPAVVAVVDAGAPAPVAAAPEAPAEAGPPWAWILGAGGAAALLFIIIVARRRAGTPKLDD